MNHAIELHPESIEYLSNIDDNSLSEVTCPWNVITAKVKTELRDSDLTFTEHKVNEVYIQVKTEQFDEVLSETKPEVTFIKGINDPLNIEGKIIKDKIKRNEDQDSACVSNIELLSNDETEENQFEDETYESSKNGSHAKSMGRPKQNRAEEEELGPRSERILVLTSVI